MKRRKINSAFLLLLLGEMLTWSSVGNTTEWESITPGVEKRHVHPTTEAIADSPIFLEGGQHVRPNADYQGRKVAGNTESLPAAHPSEKNLLRHLLEKGVPTEGGAFQPLEKVAFPHDFTKQPTVRGTWHGNAVIMTRHCAPTATPP